MKPLISPAKRCVLAPESLKEQMNGASNPHPRKKCFLFAKRRIHSLFAAAVLSSLAASDSAAASITAFNNSVWPRTDASMGIDGFVIEDFEDVTLASGLQVQVQSPSLGGYGPVSTLPFTFDPSQDLAGSAFNASLMWDGTRGLVNRPSLPITTYGNDGGWSDVSFLFAGGVSSVGFSYAQADANIVIGLDLGFGFTTFFNSLTYLPGSGSGYLRIDAGPGETIYGVRLDNQANNHDGLLYDHLAFKPVSSASVPDSAATSLLLAASLFALIGFRRRVASSLPGQQMLSLGALLSLTLLAAPARAQTLPLLAGFEGNTSGWIPADPVIAAGPNSLVTMVSGGIAVFNKQGTKLFEQNLGAGGFWAGQGADQVAEPWVIFDPNSGRFIASAAEFGSGKGRLYLAVSKNSNPLVSADWHKYSLNRTGTHQGPSFPGVPTYPDFAKTGVDGDAIYFTSAHFAKDQSITRNFSHVEIFALEKAPLLGGGALNVVYDEPVITDSFSDALVFWIQPAIVVEPEPAMYFVQSLMTLPDNQIAVHTLTDVLSASPARSVALVPVAPFDRPPHVPQLGSSALLENGNSRPSSAVVRAGSLWTAHAILDPAVDTESLVRWYQFDLTTFPGSVALAQSGNVDPGPGLHAWLPHINVDATGNLGLSFSVCGASQYAAIGYTGRLASDPAGATLPVQIARTGQGAYTQGGFGEYSGLALDPDGRTFWLFNQYPTGQRKQQWRTFIGGFQVAPPPPPANPLHCGDLDRSSANSGKG